MWTWIRRKIDDLSSELIAWVVIAALAAGITQLKSLFPDVSPLVAVYVFLGTLVLLLVLSNQYAQFRQRKQRERLTRRSAQEIESTIRNWLYDARFSVQKVADPNANFNILVEDANKRAVNIIQKKDDPYVSIVTSLFVEQKDQAAADRIFADQSKALEDLAVEMLRFGISFSGVSYPLRRVVLEDLVVFDESMTPHAFLGRVFFVRQAERLANIHMGQIRKTANPPG